MSSNSEDSIITGILVHGLSILPQCTLDSATLTRYLSRCEEEFLTYPVPATRADPNNWFIPEEYAKMDIPSWLIAQCTTEVQRMRVHDELILFVTHNMISVLSAMKYIVDVLRINDIVWGVGRGSSVASYVLYLIGVHKIDPIKYNIPITEFFKRLD